ncbi:hypothetical protein B0H13DRAFT_2364092 [Mycena leptocephala]|nr:hypothetical protein B0H13DRAFT_2364092 [Mycena leptocephala]
MSVTPTVRAQGTRWAACAGWVGIVWDPVQRANVPRYIPSSVHEECATIRIWDITTFCECRAPWMSHAQLHVYVLCPAAPAPAPPAPAALATITTLGSSQPPIDMFMGVPACPKEQVSLGPEHSICGGRCRLLARDAQYRVSFPRLVFPEIKFKNLDARKYATALRERQLIISVTVPSQGLMSPAEFSRQISAHFAAHIQGGLPVHTVHLISNEGG